MWKKKKQNQPPWGQAGGISSESPGAAPPPGAVRCGRLEEPGCCPVPFLPQGSGIRRLPPRGGRAPRPGCGLRGGGAVREGGACGGIAAPRSAAPPRPVPSPASPRRAPERLSRFAQRPRRKQ